MYCVKCRQKRVMTSVRQQMDKRGRPRLMGTCTTCGTKSFQYISTGRSLRRSRL